MTADTETERLAEIEARIDRATPGPWKYPRRDWPGVVTSKRGCLWTSSTHSGRINHEPDADLIANAPADLRWLIDRLREAERESEGWASYAAEQERHAEVAARAETAEAALARVKALAHRYADLGRTEHPRNITKSHDACLLRDLVVLDLQQAITGDDPAPLMDDRSDS